MEDFKRPLPIISAINKTKELEFITVPAFNSDTDESTFEHKKCKVIHVMFPDVGPLEPEDDVCTAIHITYKNLNRQSKFFKYNCKEENP